MSQQGPLFRIQTQKIGKGKSRTQRHTCPTPLQEDHNSQGRGNCRRRLLLQEKTTEFLVTFQNTVSLKGNQKHVVRWRNLEDMAVSEISQS